MAGDRVKIEECICEWYGSLEAFDQYVRGPLLDKLRNQLQLGSDILVPYWCVVALGFPSILRSLEHLSVGSMNGVAWTLGYVFIMNPMFFLILQRCMEQDTVPVWLAQSVGYLSLGILWGGWGYFCMLYETVVVYFVMVSLLVFTLFCYEPSFAELGLLGFQCMQQGMIDEEELHIRRRQKCCGALPSNSSSQKPFLLIDTDDSDPTLVTERTSGLNSVDD